jgi:general nucleoside transport system permease protein
MTRLRTTDVARAADFIAPPLAVLAAFACGGVLVALLGRNPFEVYAVLARETFGSWYGFGQVLFKSTTLACTGLAVAVAFRAGLFNIGAEGQMFLGGLGAAVVALALPAGLPAPLVVATVLFAGAASGALWGAIPGVLRARLGVHEVINTIMMNFIAFAFGSWVLVRHLAQFETLHTATIPESARLPRLETWIPALRGAPVNASLLVAVALCIGVTVLLWRTRWGFEVRAVGLSEGAARHAGIPVRRRLVEAMVLSGAIAGLASCNFVQGYKYYFEDGFTAEAGFKGIAVALLARNHPLAVLPAALLFGALDRGGFVLGRLVPKEFVDILQALVLLFVIVLGPWLRRWSARRALPQAEGAAAWSS